LRALQFLLFSTFLTFVASCSTEDNAANSASTDNLEGHLAHPHLFHLVQADLWWAAVDGEVDYFPPTYDQDGFTHATANPDLLLNVANHFYKDVAGEWLCLRMTVDSLKAVGTEVVFEGTAPVGDKEADFSGTDDELFPHIKGGISRGAVLGIHSVSRNADGTFTSVAGVTSN